MKYSAISETSQQEQIAFTLRKYIYYEIMGKCFTETA